MSLLNPRPDELKVKKIVCALEVDERGCVRTDAVIKMFENLLKPKNAITKESVEVVSFMGLNLDAMVKTLIQSKNVTRSRVEEYYDSLDQDQTRAIKTLGWHMSHLQISHDIMNTKKKRLLSDGSLLNPRPNRAKAREIIRSLRVNDSHVVLIPDVIEMLSALLKIDISLLSPAHEGVSAFLSLDLDGMVENLCGSKNVTKDRLDQYHATLCDKRGNVENTLGPLHTHLAYNN